MSKPGKTIRSYWHITKMLVDVIFKLGLCLVVIFLGGMFVYLEITDTSPNFIVLLGVVTLIFIAMFYCVRLVYTNFLMVCTEKKVRKRKMSKPGKTIRSYWHITKMLIGVIFQLGLCLAGLFVAALGVYFGVLSYDSNKFDFFMMMLTGVMIAWWSIFYCVRVVYTKFLMVCTEIEVYRQKIKHEKYTEEIKDPRTKLAETEEKLVKLRSKLTDLEKKSKSLDPD